MLIEVWHATSNLFTEDACNHVHVANVELPDFIEDEVILETAYKLTNNIEDRWINNPQVTRIGVHPSRSTSVGDRIKIDNKVYQVDVVGWKEI